MAVTASFLPGSGVLSEFGDALDNTITTSRDAAGTILVNGGAVAVQGGTPTVANTSLIQVFGQGGNDALTLNEANGALPAANLFGGDGNDVLTGGSGADQLFGQSDNDTLLGKGGNDFLFGGDGNDTLTGGDADDQMFGEGGDDRLIWNPGDDSDVFEGGADTDTAEVNGGNGAETFTITPNGARVRFDRVTPAPFSLDIGTTENLVLHANGGDDVISASGNLAGLIQLTLDGGTGNDTITGGNGADIIFGGSDNDVLTGGVGDDQMFGEDGNDRFVWNPGDGTDLVEGGADFDTAEVNGANVGETFTITANGTRVRFDGLSPTPFSLDIGTTEQLVLNANGGDDVITAGNGLANLIQLTLDGGAGNDTITGGDGADTIFGGTGNDIVNGGRGNDTAFLGAGNDSFTWNPGDGSDTVEGQEGFDTLAFNGANINEIFDISANGERVRLTRNIANVTMDLNDVEHIDVRTLGGTDNVVINDLTGTDIPVGGVQVDLASSLGSPDGQLDTVTRIGTAGNDTIKVASLTTGPNAGGINITGVPAAVVITHQDAFDRAVVNGGAGNDTIDAAQATPDAMTLVLEGGIGNDTLNGSAGADQLFGQGDNDTLNGRAGNDFLFGGTGNDVLTGGVGDDQMFGEDGDDRFIWNPGDGTDLVEGGADFDTAEVNGASVGETFTITANGTRVRFDGLSPTPFSLDIGTTEQLVLKANGGDDIITAGNGLATLIQLTLDGGAGNDTITGGDGADTIFGGTGNDIVNGGRGNDTAFLGAGNDSFTWNPGDGSDTVEGQEGFDTLAFNGANINEIFDISANGERVRLTRNIANVTMDLNDVEHIDVRTLGGTDNVVINDLTGTDIPVGGVQVDLASSIGSPDGQLDTVTRIGTAGNDTIKVASLTTGPNAGGINITGVPAAVVITHQDAFDRAVVNGGAGNDTIDAAQATPDAMTLVLEGGIGNDTLNGSAGADQLFGQGDNDTLNGRAGNDFLFGGTGNDVLTGGVGDDQMFGEDGDDRFIWNPGDGTDLVEGGADFDTAEVNGASVGETFTITANGTRVRFDGLSPTPFSLDIGTTEQLVLKANGGDDIITAGNGLANLIQLTLDGGAGNDTITGGDGADTIFGGTGNDIVNGGRGNDTAFLGAGNDSFTWNPGDGNDTVEGQDGFDTLAFNGSNIGENITISANGERVSLTRNVANITTDLNDVEHIDVRTLGGTDNVVINDLTGTDIPVGGVKVDLASSIGSPDGQLDTVTSNGTAGNDTIRVASLTTGPNAGGINITGVPAAVVITHQDATDRAIVNGGAGNDTINASQVTAGAIALTLDGGAGDDTLTGSAGADHFVFSFGNGADTITNFSHAQGDVIDLHGTGVTTFAQLQALMVDHGTFTTIDFGAGGLLNLTGLHPNQLQANDFLLT